mgnify:CR=1 FL=1
MSKEVPCVVCGLPAEEDPDMRHGSWCDTCWDDAGSLSSALLLCRSADDAKGHWFYLQEWRRSKERREGTHGLWACDKCGFLLRLPFPIGGETLCIHCAKGKRRPAEEGAAFLRVPALTYAALEKQMAELSLSWGGVLDMTVRLLDIPHVREQILAKRRESNNVGEGDMNVGLARNLQEGQL